MEISAEFNFIAQCCRWNFVGAPKTSIGDPGSLDWANVLRLIRFHRVEALVWSGLSASRVPCPDQVRQALAARAARIAAANLRAAIECRDLLAGFEAAGAPLLFVKGLTLGALAYGNAALKSAVDIDLLVEREHVGEAATLLQRRGYTCVVPRRTTGIAALGKWHIRHKESVWSRAGGEQIVDLHSRLADNPRLIPGIGIGSPSRLVAIGNGIVLPTLATEELFAYLAVHGASSAWFRLKWISDLAALLAPLPGDAIEHLYRRSQALGAGRAAAQALLLADQLFDTLHGASSLRAELCGDPISRRLFRASLRQLAEHREPVEPTSRLLGTARIHWTQLLLLPGAGFKASELWRQAHSALAGWMVRGTSG